MLLAWTDAKGREWPCKITYGIVDDVRDATDKEIDLLEVGDEKGKLLKKIYRSLPTFVNLMFLLAKCNSGPDFAVTEREFKANIDGDALERMRDAFEEALADFSSPARRETILAGIQQRKEFEEKATRKALDTMAKTNLDAMVNSLGAKLDQVLVEAQNEMIGAVSSGNPPAD